MALQGSASDDRYRKSEKGRLAKKRANTNSNKKYKRISVFFKEEDQLAYYALLGHKTDNQNINEICLAAIRNWLVYNAK